MKISESAPKESPYSVEVDQVNEGQWSSIIDLFSDASLYQTWAYGATLWNESELSHLVIRDEAGELAAAVQVRIIKIPVIGCGVAYIRWGPLCHRKGMEWNKEAWTAIMDAVVDEYYRRRRLLLRVIPRHYAQEPFAEFIRKDIEAREFERETEVSFYRTMCVDLTPSLEAIRKNLDGKWRNQLNSSERQGLEVLEGTSDELYAKFISLFDEMMARKQFESSVDVHDFRKLQGRLSDNEKMIIMITQKEGKPMTGLISSRVGAVGIYLLGATSNEGMKSKGSYLLQWRMMTRLKELGCASYDLGGINPEGNPGVYHFKEGMGGVERSEIGRFALGIDSMSGKAVALGERLKKAKGLFKPAKARETAEA